MRPVEQLSHRQRDITPIRFRDMLIELANTTHPSQSGLVGGGEYE